jgi:hypothetical protein
MGEINHGYILQVINNQSQLFYLQCHSKGKIVFSPCFFGVQRQLESHLETNIEVFFYGCSF